MMRKKDLTTCPNCCLPYYKWQERLVICGTYYHLYFKVSKAHEIFWIGERIHHADLTNTERARMLKPGARPPMVTVEHFFTIP